MYVLNVYCHSRLVHAGLPITGRLTVGRSEDCDVVIGDPSISRCHLALDLTELGPRDLIVLRDEGSRNGIFVNSQKVSERVIGPGDCILFGACRLEVVEVDKGEAFPESAAKDTVVMRRLPDGDGDKSAARRLRALHSLAASMTDLDIPFVLERTAEIVKSCLEFDELCVFLEGRKGFVPCTCWSGHGPCGKDDLHPVEASIQGALRLGRPFFTRTTIQLREGSLDERTPVHVVACPMVASSRTIGILYCARFGHAASFGGEDVQFLSLVASFAASAISHQWNLSHAQRSTAKLEAILGSLREGVIVCDHEFRILSANQAARRMLGRRHVIGVELSEILSGFAHSFDPKAVIATRTFDIERPSDGKLDGEGTSYRATLSRLSTLDDLGPQFIICVRDVSIERYNELLQLRVVHRLAHKLRTPLTLLGSASSILGERPLESNPETQDLLRVLRENVEKLSDIVDRFLDCTGTEEHRPGLSLAQIAVPLDYVLAQSIGLAADEIRKSGLRIDDRLGPLRDLELVVNPERLCRSFHQIIQNACKFAGSGSTLVIEAWLDDALRVRFTDDGPGVPPDHLEALFDLFHQIDGENTGEIPGLGLGLWWTREAIRGHGGDVYIESPAIGDHGLSVEILLPKYRVRDAEREELVAER